MNKQIKLLKILGSIAILAGGSALAITATSCEVGSGGGGGGHNNAEWNCGASFLIDNMDAMPFNEFHLQDDLTMSEEDTEFIQQNLTQKNIFNALVFTQLITSMGKGEFDITALTRPATITLTENSVKMSISSVDYLPTFYFLFTVTQLSIDSFNIQIQAWDSNEPDSVTTVEWTECVAETLAVCTNFAFMPSANSASNMINAGPRNDTLWELTLNSPSMPGESMPPQILLSTYDTKNIVNYNKDNDMDYWGDGMEDFYNEKESPLEELELTEGDEEDGGDNTDKLIAAINSQNLINGFAYYYWTFGTLYKLDSKTPTTFLAFFSYSEFGKDFSLLRYVSCSDLTAAGAFHYQNAVQDGGYWLEDSSCQIVGSNTYEDYESGEVRVDLHISHITSGDMFDIPLAPCDLVNVTLAE